MEKHGKHRPLVGAGLALALLAAPADAGCRLALALALDISSSVDSEEDRLQRLGLANALTSPEVLAAVLSVPGDPVALAVFEWSGRYQQDVTLTWRLLRTEADIVEAAATIRRSQRRYAEFPTAIGYALGYAAGVFAQAPACLFQTLDVSGDGVNNDGFAPRLAYANFPLAEVTVNGLTIGGVDDDLAGYYRRELIKGPGAFVEEAADFSDFERAMRRKLVRELETRAIGLGPLPVPLRRGG
ncbi:MAG: DUF1194 domain-containing protein [Rhodobacter sp.]|nr:DUF1194 domain-containing protein [Rhodobacter sp.]